MEKKRLFVAVVIVWVVGTVTTYYLYSRGHLQKVSDVKIPLAMRFSSLRGLTDTPTTNVPQAGQQLTSAPTTAQPTPGRTKIGSQEQEQRLAMAERVELADDGSNIYISVLTTPGYHDSRLSRQYITWMQTVHPKQVHVVTEGGEDMWTEALTRAGYQVVYCDCPRDSTKTQRMMCCKGGVQFDHWYQARDAGAVYNWYCHFDDDIYVNAAALIEMTRKFDHNKDQYLGKWKRLSQQVYGSSDRISGWTAPGLYNFPERKHDNYRYANGPAYCISAHLMNRLEKYLRGQNFVSSCNRAQAVMDDVLPGVIIEGVLGVEITDIPEITDQLDSPPYDDRSWYKHQITVASERIQLPSGKYHGWDMILSYHCLLYPGVSWCK
eukprot:Em0003g1324a